MGGALGNFIIPMGNRAVQNHAGANLIEFHPHWVGKEPISESVISEFSARMV